MLMSWLRRHAGMGGNDWVQPWKLNPYRTPPRPRPKSAARLEAESKVAWRVLDQAMRQLAGKG